MTKRNTKYYLAAFVPAVTFAVYLFVLRNDFVIWDDDLYVVDNLRIRSMNWMFFKWAFTDTSSVVYWHPLTWISHAVDYFLWGLNPAGHHLTAIILHALNTFTVIYMVIRLLEVSKGTLSGPVSRFMSDERNVLITAGVTGILFGLHPIHVESVAWISERKDLLYALFFMLSIISYSGYVGTVVGTEDQRILRGSFLNRWYLLSFLFFVFSLSSKPMAITLPVVLLVLDWYPYRRITSIKKALPVVVEKAPFFVLSILVSVVTFIAQREVGAMTPMRLLLIPARVLVAFKALVMYLWKMTIPLDLLPLYPYPESVSISKFEYLSAAIMVIAITAACIRMVKTRKIFLTAWVYYAVILFPVLGIVQVGLHYMADRFTYLASLAPFLLMGMGVSLFWTKAGTMERWSKPVKTASITAGLVLCVFMSYLTVKQIMIWQDSITLWSYVIEKEPDRVPLAYNNRGVAYNKREQLELAMKDYTTAIALDPGGFLSYTNRGQLLKKMDRLDGALEDLNRAIALEPDSAYAYTGRGQTFRKMGKIALALKDLTKAIQLDGQQYVAYTNRGMAYKNMGRIDRALDDLSTAIKVNPYYENAYISRGIVLKSIGRFDEALKDYDAALALNPLSVEGHNNKGVVFKHERAFDSAIEEYGKAIAIDPSFYLAFSNRGIVYKMTGKIDEAITDFTKALSLNPRLVMAYLERGDLHLKRGNRKEAIEDFQKACDLGDRSGCDLLRSLKP